jgi:FkbM family methyltransferase
MRPSYEKLLDGLTGGKGIPWSINGETYQVDSRHRNCFPPIYEPGLAMALRTRVKPGSVCLDVGANIGLYALQFAAWSQPGGRVIAFEPNPGAIRVLKRHLHLNGITDRVDVAPFAAGRSSRQAILYAADHSGMSRLGQPNKIIAGVANSISVNVVSLDSYCRERDVSPDILLMDIEGFEMAALAGAAGIIAERGERLSIFVEMHPAVWDSAGTTVDAAKKLLRTLHRKVVSLSGQADPFADYGHVELVHAQ